MTEYAGRGDPRRTLELLWGRVDAPTRGPKPGIDVGAVVAAAIAVADEGGLASVSMRAVAQRLGRSPMSLYTYVPGKAELLDLMHDAVLGELPTDYSGFGHWRAATEASVRAVWALYERHPWMLHIAGGRNSLGPNSFQVFETQLGLLDGIGLDGLEMTRLAGAIQTFVQGAAQTVADVRAAAAATGVSDDEWWTARAPLLEELTTQADWASRYPTIARLEAERVFEQPDRDPADETPYLERDALDTFESGLRCLLDGIEALAARRHA